DAGCGGGAGSCVQTRLPRLSSTDAQGIWAAGVAQWSQICWNPDTYTCSAGTNGSQTCDPNGVIATECPKTVSTDPQPTCDSCTAFGPERPISVFPRTVTSGTRACQTQVVHANNGLPFVGGAGNNVDVLYPSNVVGIDLGQPGCTDNETTLTTYPYTISAGSDGLCDECPDLDGDVLCDIRFREGTGTGDVVADVIAVADGIGFVGADRVGTTFYGVGYDKGLHTVEAMRNGSSALWCALTYNKRPDNTYDANTLKTVNSIIDRVGTARVVEQTGSVFSGEPAMKVFKNLDRGPLQFK
ncbi:MAG: hypothetical protein Q8R92_02475, partial [Deltaproteobacteria bacterium]|nr:hypothetical protein [Deltaproteobacteria bacterium]